MSVTFEMITKDNVNSFLDYLTEEKKFAPATRNNRLYGGEKRTVQAINQSVRLSGRNYLDGFTTGIINSDVLGKAFEPEQRFEERDGSDIVFQSDYLGNHRGVSTIPGPFADVKELDEVIWMD